METIIANATALMYPGVRYFDVSRLMSNRQSLTLCRPDNKEHTKRPMSSRVWLGNDEMKSQIHGLSVVLTRSYFGLMLRYFAKLEYQHATFQDCQRRQENPCPQFSRTMELTIQSIH